MAIPDFVLKFQEVFWDDEYKHLDYFHESFNDPAAVHQWEKQGYAHKFTGAMCDMRKPQPSWNHMFVDKLARGGWKDIGTCYYRMDSGTILPVHSDTYKRYIELFNLQGKEHTIRRMVVFLEDWKSGHYLELNNVPIVGWNKGHAVAWHYDTPHMAANMGIEPRYTLQITGHVDED